MPRPRLRPPASPPRLALAALLGATGTLHAQDCPPPDATLQARSGFEFTRIGSVAPARRDALIVVDEGDRSVHAVSLPSMAIRRVGTNGGGPGEYRSPRRVFRVGDGTFALYDQGLGRLTLLDVPWRLRKTMPLPSISPVQLRAVDAAGTVYLTDLADFRTSRAPGGLLGGRTTHRDSVAFRRRDLATGEEKELGRLALPRRRSSMPSVIAMDARGAGPWMPLDAEDAWFAHVDGTFGTVIAAGYRLRWHAADGTVTREVTLPRNDRPVTEEDRRAHWSVVGNDSIGLADCSPSGCQVKSWHKPPFPADWPERMRPFVPEASFMSADGTIWLRRSGNVPEPAACYDLAWPSGRTTQLSLPPGRTAMAADRDLVVAVTSDDDGLQALELYRVARLAGK